MTEGKYETFEPTPFMRALGVTEPFGFDMDSIRAEARSGPWQPIETAPAETDLRVLVFADEEVVIGYRNSFYDGAPWWQCEDDGPLNWGGITPTHWMPLPGPPPS